MDDTFTEPYPQQARQPKPTIRNIGPWKEESDFAIGYFLVLWHISRLIFAETCVGGSDQHKEPSHGRETHI